MSWENTYAQVLGGEPPEVERPSSIDEVAEVIARAAARGLAVIPWGGGTGQAYGYLPRRADVLLDMTQLNRVVAVEPGDLTFTVEAGATLAQVQNALSAVNQFLPLDPGHGACATIGGILATDAFGPSRTFYGSARDYLIGLTVVDAEGRIVKGGGKVVKNVTGYDTPKLHVGALGTLGVIVEATFKVVPRPEVSRALWFELPGEAGGSVDGIAAFLARIVGETAPALGLVRDMTGNRVAAFIYSGTAPVVESGREAALAIAETAGVPPTPAAPAGMDRPFTDCPAPPEALVFRISGLPATEFARHDALARLFAPVLTRLDTFPGCGQTEIVLPSDLDAVAVARHLVEWAAANGASVTVPQAPPELRARDTGVSLWSPLPPSLPLMKRLKMTLDPAGTINPGRFIDGI